MNKTISKKNLIILGVILVAFPFVADKMFNWNYGVLLANFAILYIIAVSGLDILFGYSGQISMGHAAFYCIGAYGSVLIHQFTGLPVIVTILMGTVIATLIGALLPSWCSTSCPWRPSPSARWSTSWWPSLREILPATLPESSRTRSLCLDLS